MRKEGSIWPFWSVNDSFNIWISLKWTWTVNTWVLY